MRTLPAMPGKFACLTAALLALGLWGAGGGGRGSDATSSASSSSAGTAGERQAQLFSVPAEQMAHVQLTPVAAAPLPRILRLTGSVAYNSFETTPVITQVSGPVARILSFPGQIVEAGQPMLEVSSPDFAQLRTNYLKAQDAYQLAMKSYDRANDLYTHRAIALADLEQAESTRNQAQADLLAAEQALKVLGIRTDQVRAGTPSPDIPVLAPIAGEVVERLAGPGQVIQAGVTQVFTISNMPPHVA